MATFVWTPDYDLANPKTARVNKAKFGDGYSQRSTDTINNIDEKLSASFTGRTRAEVNAIDAFLTARAGVESFDYTIPGSVSKKYTCETWTPSYKHDGDSSITAEFERVYEL